ncbi:hypothetical protein A3Q56_01869 [Intoshia linei]|uniref:Piezo non-specific cation channel cap domain-containing protein n=1 Tax=Intoshia linei TaxID=1819745 RepID=A0A177B9W8_9BILA|nr:hypothetical protein A3Q56_01869 [Intoshia linei]
MNDSVWWSVNEEGKIDFNIIAYSERISIGILSIISSYGIIGLYLSLVLVISKFLRIILSGYSNRIMFEELPNVDKLLNLCNDIFTVREAKDFRLEEELFSKLMFIYRSPAHLIEWTKYQRLKTKTE